MTRRLWLFCLGLAPAWLLALASRPARADEQQATLNETLRSVLKCRRPQEFAFVNLVTDKVDQGQLPKAMVLSMMDWARRRATQESAGGRRTNEIPFPYFQEGLRRQAAAIGVDLPAFQPLIVP
jgi:hypothetical protein